MDNFTYVGGARFSLLTEDHVRTNVLKVTVGSIKPFNWTLEIAGQWTGHACVCDPSNNIQSSDTGLQG